MLNSSKLRYVDRVVATGVFVALGLDAKRKFAAEVETAAHPSQLSVWAKTIVRAAKELRRKR